MVKRQVKQGTARTSPLNDAQAPRPTPVRSGQGLQFQVWAGTIVPRLKLRFAT